MRPNGMPDLELDRCGSFSSRMPLVIGMRLECQPGVPKLLVWNADADVFVCSACGQPAYPMGNAVLLAVGYRPPGET